MASNLSRYYICVADLINRAKNLQIGKGIADRMSEEEVLDFINEAEDWVEERISNFFATPLKPTRSAGQSACPTEADYNKRNFPRSFIEAVEYRSLGHILQSEYFENSPNMSDSAEKFLEQSEASIQMLLSQRNVKVGSGRRTHPNPFFPPNLSQPYRNPVTGE